MKLSVKVPVLLGAIVMVLAVGFAAWLHLVMTNATEQAARDTALQSLQVARSAYSSGATLPEFALLDDPSMPADLKAEARAGRTATYLFEDPPQVWAATSLPEGYVLAVRQDWSSGSNQLDDLDWYLVVGVLSVAAVTVLLALGTGVALSRRLGRAELTARRIADGELGLRVSEAVRGRDEVASLGAAIDHLASSMQERLASEQRVTGYIAHDLRTPVTSLVTASSLLPDDRAGNLVRSQATRLWRLIEDLLEVARLDSAEQQVERVATTTEALARAAVEAASQPVRLVVEESADVTTDPRRVQRALVNLLENSIRHGDSQVECVVRGPAILVQDEGAGFPPVLLEHGPRRFVTGSPSRGGGSGLGLTIAAGQAAAIGATLALANRADRPGALATLTLPTT